MVEPYELGAAFAERVVEYVFARAVLVGEQVYF